jgi:hypothetical protein
LADECDAKQKKPPAIAEDKRKATVTSATLYIPFRANLEAARLKAVTTLAATQAAFSTDALRELATLQAALTAVRKGIQAHGVGWEVMIR